MYRMVCILALLAACSDGTDAPPGDTDMTQAPADFAIQVGVETVTVLDAEPNTELTLFNEAGDKLVTQVTNERGVTHFAYLPPTHRVIDFTSPDSEPVTTLSALSPAETYVIRGEESGQWSGEFSVLGVDETPEQAFYDEQVLEGVPYSPLDGLDGDPEDAFHYLTMRDGVTLSATVRLPSPLFYGEGPYPTVVEYSGYAPSRPDRPDQGTFIANALGFATVSVNMRGSGCSGGVFDVFNRAQHADGYDIIEIVAAQDWVLGGRVGMVGLSYSGITQLYVASTNPPSLGAIVPLSTIADAWQMQWPGGIYNQGFTRQWVNRRESESKVGGSSWVTERIENGDTQCEKNLELSDQSVDFETFLRALDTRPAAADDRDLRQLVEQIEAPVFLGGQFQDEQTGAQFGSYVNSFYQSSHYRALLSNGRHPDGFAPYAAYQWFEFLEFHLARRIPSLNPIIRSFGADEFGAEFGMSSVTFPEDRFTDAESFEAAFEAYTSEPPIRVLFELGGGTEEPGVPVARFQQDYEQWPPSDAGVETLYLSEGASLTEEEGDSESVSSWTHDPLAGEVNFFGEAGYQILRPLWDVNWTPFVEDEATTFTTAPFSNTKMLSGFAVAELWVKSPVDEFDVQVTLTEIRPDGKELYIQSGWLRAGHRAGTIEDDLSITRTFDSTDFEAVTEDEWTYLPVSIPTFAHAIRQGSQLRITVSSPGRDHGTWQFESPDYGEAPTFELGTGGAHASSLSFRTLQGLSIPESYPSCEGLRGQVCRDLPSDEPID